MENVSVNHEGIGQFLKSQKMRSLVRERAEIAQAVYQGIVAKRTGRTARGARVETFIGGRRMDRWYGRLIVESPAVLPHEFGRGIHPGSTDAGRAGKQQAADDLNTVLNTLGAISGG
jgi:hypothetical protein